MFIFIHFDMAVLSVNVPMYVHLCAHNACNYRMVQKYLSILSSACAIGAVFSEVRADVFCSVAGGDLLIDFVDDPHGPLCPGPPCSHGWQHRICSLQPWQDPLSRPLKRGHCNICYTHRFPLPMLH